MSPFATLAVGFAGGVASWFFTSFVGEPVQHLRNLRRSAAAKVIELGNTGPPPEHIPVEARRPQWERVEHASTEIRKAAVDLKVFAATQPFITVFATKLGYDIHLAGASLMGFSSAIHQWGNDRHGFRKAFNKAMKISGY